MKIRLRKRRRQVHPMNQFDLDGFPTDRTGPLPVYRQQRNVPDGVELRKRRRNSIKLIHTPSSIMTCGRCKINLVCTLTMIIALLVAALCYTLVVIFEKKTTANDHITDDILDKHAALEQHGWQKVGIDELRQSIKYQPNTNKAKNVILFVGDGMGISTATATRIYKYGEGGALSWESFPHVGLLKVSLFMYDVRLHRY